MSLLYLRVTILVEVSRYEEIIHGTVHFYIHFSLSQLAGLHWRVKTSAYDTLIIPVTNFCAQSNHLIYSFYLVYILAS